MGRYFCIVAILAMALHCQPAGSAQPPKDIKARFVAEAPGKWEGYQRIGNKLRGKKVGRATIIDGGNVIRRTVWEEEIKLDNDAALLKRGFSKRDTKGKQVRVDQFEEVLGSNSKYSFHLSRSEAGKDWILSQIDMNPRGRITRIKKSVHSHVFSEVGSHFRIADTNLWELVKSPKFFIIGAKADQRAGRSVVRIDFTFEQAQVKWTDTYQGYMLLDPDHYWCILEYEARMTRSNPASSGLLRVVNDYWIGSQDLPILKSTRSKFAVPGTDDKNTDDRELEDDYDLHQVRSIPEYELTLSAFGLPEPQGIVWDRGPPYYLWFAGAAVVALALAVYFRWKAVRKARAVHPI
jgi:hypothetical protein